MKQLLPLIVAGVLQILGISAILASVFAVEMPLAWKCSLLGALALACLILARLSAVYDRLTDLLYAMRVTFVAVEVARTRPDDKTPAQALLLSDLKEEAELKQAHEELAGLPPVLTSGVIGLGYLLCTALVTWGLYALLRSAG